MCRFDCPLAALVRAPVMQTGKGEVVNSRRIDVGLKVIHADRPRAVLHGNIDFLLLSNHFQRFFTSLHLFICKIRKPG